MRNKDKNCILLQNLPFFLLLQTFKDCFNQLDCNFDNVSKITDILSFMPGVFKIAIFQNLNCDARIPFYDVSGKAFSRELKFTVDAV